MNPAAEPASLRTEKINATDYAREKIALRYELFDEITDLKSVLRGFPYTTNQWQTQDVCDLINNLNERTYADENMSQADLSKICTDSFKLLATLSAELFVKRYQLARDVITAYVRNCCEMNNNPAPTVYQLDRMFPVEELTLKYAIENLHLYVMKIKQHRPQAYQSYVVRFPEQMRIIHGLEERDAFSIKHCSKVLFRRLGSRSWDNPGLNWGKISMILMIIANAVCDMARKSLNEPEKFKKMCEKISIMIDYAAEQTASFIARRENWQSLKGINRDTELPTIDMIIPPYENEGIHPELFDRIPSIESECFAGVSHPPVPMPTPRTIARSEMLGKSVIDLHKYLEETSSHMKPRRRFN